MRSALSQHLSAKRTGAIACGLLLLLLPMCARADTIYLTNGGVLEGSVHYEDGKVYIEVANGMVILDESKVDRVEKKKTELDEFDQRIAALKDKTTATAVEYAALGAFAADNGLSSRATDAYKKALSLDPDNAAARAALNYVNVHGAWMTPDEAARANGLVKYNGGWVTLEQRGDLERLHAQAEASRAEQDRMEAESGRTDTERAISDNGETYGPTYYGGTVFGGALVRPPLLSRGLAPMGQPMPQVVYMAQSRRYISHSHNQGNLRIRGEQGRH